MKYTSENGKFSMTQLGLDSPLSISGSDISLVIDKLFEMIFIREVEVLVAKKRELGTIGGPVHLAAGQEAIPVGITEFLNQKDAIFSAHRSHAHLLAMNPRADKLFAELLGKTSGFSRGFGGSMHLWSGDSGFMGSVPIVAGTVPIAVGAAFSFKYRGQSSIAVAYFGDGAIEEGVVHESMNIASKFELPILFVCENNLFSSHMHIEQRQPSLSTARFALANQIETEIVDGNNLIECLAAGERLINFIRKEKKPAFLEAFTYRLYGHVDWREDLDVGVGRSRVDVDTWRSRDPIERLVSVLVKSGKISPNKIDKKRGEIRGKLIELWNEIENSPDIQPEKLLNHVYFGLSEKKVN